MDIFRPPGWPRSRWLGIAIGLGTHLLFIVMVWYLFIFLDQPTIGQSQASLTWDAFLSLQFVVVHSWLLLPSTKRRITTVLAPEFYGLLFCIATSLGLLGMIVGWEFSPVVIWKLNGVGAALIKVGFYGSWLTLFYSFSLTGFGYQTGYTPWLSWVRREPQPRRSFSPRGIYRVMRHPSYISFLGLIWFTPLMTLDHAVYTGIWTVYVFVGSYLKDERLAYYYGNTYREYQSRVPGYPLMIGPLGIRRLSALPVESMTPSVNREIAVQKAN